MKSSRAVLILLFALSACGAEVPGLEPELLPALEVLNLASTPESSPNLVLEQKEEEEEEKEDAEEPDLPTPAEIAAWYHAIRAKKLLNESAAIEGRLRADAAERNLAATQRLFRRDEASRIDVLLAERNARDTANPVPRNAPVHPLE